MAWPGLPHAAGGACRATAAQLPGHPSVSSSPSQPPHLRHGLHVQLSQVEAVAQVALAGAGRHRRHAPQLQRRIQLRRQLLLPHAARARRRQLALQPRQLAAVLALGQGDLGGGAGE